MDSMGEIDSSLDVVYSAHAIHSVHSYKLLSIFHNLFSSLFNMPVMLFLIENRKKSI